ncbi:M28 family peptidase [Sphingomonas montanisoli]|uniref:M28 family peptidase n=1 Tax=Sphingomonas montanisoli TaxID=2606412 RepID=A0A5D9CDX1_9SPHN|nr:M28 family peptidase [Sphingomonas montanisoli]TZG29537.1 M28 family peptidase [Sphingomonas montanisoli]
MKSPVLLALLLTAAPALAAPEAANPKELHATVEKLVSFGTRHTLSTTTDPRRGIGAARTWAAHRFGEISKACGGCLTVEQVADTFTGPRAPKGIVVANVLAIQKGSEEPNRVIMIAGHIDSRVTDVMNFTSDAPGANDDGSGSALVVEAARILSKTRPKATIVYALLSGEEQGLWGGQLLARTAKDRGWQVTAMLNNDIVGNTHGTAGNHIDDKVRVFSEGIRSSEDADAAKLRRGIGGEDDGPSRALAKYVDGVATRIKGLEVLAIRRPDRFQRGGDHSPSLDLGYPAIRFSEATENYDREHQDLRTENGRVYGDTIDAMDFPYLARVTDINVATIAALANAPAAPANATIAGALSNDTTVKWDAVPGAAGYRVYWRRADGMDWTDHRDVKGAAELFLKDVNIDDTFFGVSALAADGSESLISFCAGQPRKN